MPQTASGFTVPASGDAVSTIPATMVTFAGQVAESWSQITTGSTASGNTLNLTGLGSYDKYYLTWTPTTTTSVSLVGRFNSDAASNYIGSSFWWNTTPQSQSLSTSFLSGGFGTNTSSANITLLVTGAKSSGFKYWQSNSLLYNGTQAIGYIASGMWTNTASLTSINFTSSGTFSAGTYYLYGSN